MRWLPYGLFFFSGCSGLIFQVLWARRFALVFGSTVYAGAATVAAFLLGLGLGAWAAGRWASRLKRPVFWFGAAELLVGLTGLAVLLLVPHLGPLSAWLTQNAPSLALGRLLVVLALLIVPCFCMGASLPLLCQHYTGVLGGDFLSSLSRLYAVNTLGAACGAWMADFVLVPSLGVSLTGLAAACLNLTVAFLALSLGGPRSVELPLADEVGQPPPGWVLALLAGSGFCGIVLELIWTRLLAFANGSDVFAFSSTLTTYLAGLVIGALLLNLPGARRLEARKALALSLILLACTALASIFTLALVYPLRVWLAARIGTAAALLLANSVLLLPSTIALGFMFPLASQVCLERLRSAPGSVGRAFLYNTFGSVSGSLLAGFVLLPYLGLQTSLQVAACLALLLALLAWPRALGFCLVLGACLWLIPGDFLQRVLYPRDFAGLRFQADDHYGSVALIEQPDPVSNEMDLNLLVDGFNMAGNSVSARRYTTFLAAMPIMLHPSPKRVLVICLGLGNTLSAAVDAPWTERVDCVELSTKVIAALRLLPQGQVLDSPKLRLIVSDGRNYLLSTTEKYDVITAEPPPPTHAGVVNLYSREYYELCRARLNPGGMAVQWLPVFNMSTRDAKMIARAFQDVFPYTYLWQAAGLQLVLIGSESPIELSYPLLSSRVGPYRPRLAPTSLDHADWLAASLLAGPEDLRKWVGETPPLTDDWPMLQYSDARQWVPDVGFYFFSDRTYPWAPESGRRINRQINVYQLGSGRFPNFERYLGGRELLTALPDSAYVQLILLVTPGRLASALQQHDYLDAARIHFMTGQFPAVLQDIASLLALKGVPPEVQAYALAFRGLALWQMREFGSARLDFEAALKGQLAPAERPVIERLSGGG